MAPTRTVTANLSLQGGETKRTRVVPVANP